MTKFFKTLFFICLLNPLLCLAQDVYFAGFTFVGDHSQKNIRYPYAAKIFEQKAGGGVDLLSNTLFNEIKNFKRSDVILKQELGSLKSGNSLSLAFALNDESIESNRWNGKYLYIYRVVASILIFDFGEKKIIANYPVMVQFQDLVDAPRSDVDHDNAFNKIYLDTGFDKNIFKEWVRKLESATIRPSYKEYLQIRSVNLEPEALAVIPDELKQGNVYATQVAQLLEFLLSANQGVPLLPFTTGQSIADTKNGMIARFVDGAEYQLKLPPPGFVIDIIVRSFKHAAISANGIKQNAYGAFVTLKVEEPEFKRVILDTKFKNINYVNFSEASDTQIDNWQAYQTSLRGLLSTITKQISLRNKDVLEKITQEKGVEKNLSSFHEIIKKCI